jgi:hypothetical protein
MQEKLECTFTPEITKTIPEYERTDYDKTTRRYFDRVQKAKKRKEEIHSIINPDYSKYMKFKS